VDWERQIDMLNKIKRGEDEAAAARPQVATPPMHDWFRAAEERARAEELARLERDRVATEAHLARQRQQAQAGQDAQAVWAKTRNELRDRVVELQRALAAAESRMQGSDMDDAVRASGEVAVYRAQVEAAQAGYARHCQWSPL
jgi:hypothetical protein